MSARRFIPMLIVAALVGLLLLQATVFSAWDGADLAEGWLPFDGQSLLTWGAMLLPLVVVTCLHPQWRTALLRKVTPKGRSLERNEAGVALFGRGGPVAATAEFTEAIRLNPQLPAAYVNRGAMFCELDRLDEALADLDTAIRLAPTLADAYSWRSAVWRKKGVAERALADVNEALRLAPRHAGALVQRTLLRLERNELDDALADVNQALAIDRGLVEAYYWRGNIWLGKNQFDKAIEDYTEILLRGAPPSAAVYRDRGLAWYFKGDLDRALSDLNEAIALEPKDAIAHNNRGAALAKGALYAQARADFQKAIHLLPQHPSAHKNLAWLLATCPLDNLRDGPQAVEHARQALDLAKEKAPAEWLGILAAALAEAGDFDDALRWQTRCVQQAPSEKQAEQAARLTLYENRLPFRERPV